MDLASAGTGMLQRAKTLAAVCALCAGLAACGMKGSLETPPEAKADQTAPASSGQGKEEGATGKPHKPFILDGILR